MDVVMQRIPLDNRWRPWQWRPLQVFDAALPAGQGPHCLRDAADDTRWLFPGFEVELFADEAEGYFLNISAPAPCWFVMWRLEQIGDAEIAVPKTLTLSYNEAARLMDGGEQVDTVPASAPVIGWLRQFVALHYHPEPKKKRRKPSFEGGAEVEKMARAEGEIHGG